MQTWSDKRKAHKAHITAMTAEIALRSNLEVLSSLKSRFQSSEYKDLRDERQNAPNEEPSGRAIR
eukprot:3683286-Amphidinium_carterae.1